MSDVRRCGSCGARLGARDRVCFSCQRPLSEPVPLAEPVAFADIPYGNLGMGWGWAAFIGLLAALAAAAPVMVPAARSYLEIRNANAGPRG